MNQLDLWNGVAQFDCVVNVVETVDPPSLGAERGKPSAGGLTPCCSGSRKNAAHCTVHARTEQTRNKSAQHERQ